MTLPLPLIGPENAARMLSSAYVTLSRLSSGFDDRAPALLLVLPPAWVNRYQSLLYCEAGPRRHVTMGLSETTHLQHISWPGPVILHVHWFASLFNKCQTEVEAVECFHRFRDEIEEFRNRTGAKLLWTAHNVFPHGNRFPATFLELRQWVFEKFDMLHVMHDTHVPILEQAFGRKAPVHFTVPHMLYDGSHPNCVSPAAAKMHYGIAPDTFVFAYFGSIHPYKNLEALLHTFDRIAADSARPVSAIIGGVPSHPATVQRLQQGWGMNPKVRLLLNAIPDYEIQHIHQAADAMVLPYDETLNSGAAFMAASFEKPFIMPVGLASVALDGLGAIRFDASQPNSLEEAMRDVMEGKREHANPSLRMQHAAGAVSDAFFNALEPLIDIVSADAV